MAATIVDTNVVVAFSHARDQYHDRASRIVSGIDRGTLPEGIVTNYVVAESLNLVGERFEMRTAHDLLDRLAESSGFRIVHATKGDFDVGRTLYRTYDGLSFVDAVTTAHMRREDVTYLYSFDDDFDAVGGITRLASAANPFS